MKNKLKIPKKRNNNTKKQQKIINIIIIFIIYTLEKSYKHYYNVYAFEH